MERIELTPGVHLNVIAGDKFKTNYLCVNFIVPLEKESAHLTALFPKILSRGCRNYPSMASISERLEYLYASGLSPVYVKRAESIIVGFSAEFIKDAYLPDGETLLGDVTDLLFDILFDPLTENGVFRADYTESEKIDLINGINAKINNKAAYAKGKCTALMFRSHPYGLSETGTAEDVKNATAAQAFARYREIADTAPIEIFFNGECDVTALSERLRGRLPVRPNRKTDFPTRSFLVGEPDAVNEVTEEMPVAQGKLVMGLRMGQTNINSEDAAAFSVFNEIFGGSPSSKLFMNVREAMSLCYYCRSMPDMFMSAMFIAAGIETENRTLAADAILAQLDAMKRGEFTKEDIDDAKRSLINAYKELDDSPASLSLWYLSRIIFRNGLTPETVVRAVEKVSTEEIVRAANKVSLDTVYFIKGTGVTDGEQEESK